MKTILFQMRDTLNKKGLIDLISYINNFVNTKNINMIEIGSYSGESTVIFAEYFKNVIAIDPFIDDYDPNDLISDYMPMSGVYESFLNNISKFENIIHIKETSDDAINNLSDLEISFVYIDGLHTYDQVKKDIKNYIPIIKDGFISGHDYHITWSNIVQGVNESIGFPDRVFDDNSWIKRIINNEN